MCIFCQMLELQPGEKEFMNDLVQLGRDKHNLSAEQALHAIMCAAGLINAALLSDPNEAVGYFKKAATVGLMIHTTNDPTTTDDLIH